MSAIYVRPDILTFSGHYFSYVEPDKSDFGIEDIAHALAQLCRFAGHTREFYSVAQHCLLVSHLVPAEMALSGLLHDAAEAFMVDVPRPLKQLLPDYKAIEARVDRAVLARFGISYPLTREVHRADRVALFIEQRDLMAPHDDDWALLEDVVDENYNRILPLLPHEVEPQFLNRYHQLVGATAAGLA